MQEELLNKSIDEIDKTDNIEIGPFELSNVYAGNKKLYKLLDPENQDFEFKVSENRYVIEFKEIIFINAIKVASKTGDSHKIEFLINSISDGKEYGIRPKERINEAETLYEINQVVNKIQFTGNKPLWDITSIKITKVEIQGILIREIENTFKAFKRITELRKESLSEIRGSLDELKKSEIKITTEVNKLAVSRGELINEIDGRKAENNIIITETKKLVEDKKIAQDALAETEATLSKKEERLTQLNDSESKLISAISTKKSESESLQASVNKLNIELKSLKRSISMFSNEFSSFFKQSNLYIFIYAALSALPVYIIYQILSGLYDGTIELAVVYKTIPNLNVANIFITRLPFVLIAGAIIQSCYYIAKILILKIFDIQNEKLAVSKLSIVAQNIAENSSVGTEVSEDKVLEANIYLRMELLKKYLEKEIGKDYVYNARDKSILDQIGSSLPKPSLPKSAPPTS
ncbi:hypothetical protein A0128_20335 [Leptospira tipperaryensis]|uniref:Uncharacterized protein n=1 Tax=Leptospira tipperaryensis TaxID=2564040 RepID=A0A1D7V3I3_9LEPT|nr:hypothetical protein [Leptospira tipperaryensis]AOP36369.1 hypothetical protein A0128_20335 [Leptospira tipperaryensis]